jgi:hypothetical protein
MNEKVEIEKEIEDINNDGHVTNPFSAKDIKISNESMVLSKFIEKLKNNEIDLGTKNIKNEKEMSILIESILLRLPLTIFYFDVSDPSKWKVIDGLWRIIVLKKFIIDRSFKLKNLEFLKKLNDKGYEELEKSFKRIIDDTNIITYQVEAQTPKEMRDSIYKRIHSRRE